MKRQKKAEPEETEKSEKRFHIPLPLSFIEDLFRKVLLKPVFDPLELGEELLEFEKRKDKGMTSKD